MVREQGTKEGWVRANFMVISQGLFILMGDFYNFFAIFTKTGRWIVTKSHSTLDAMIQDILMYVLCLAQIKLKKQLTSWWHWR